MRIRLAIPDRHVTPAVLEAALEATALANEQAIVRGEAPHVTDLIQRGLKWKPEPFTDGEHFDLIEQFAHRGWADCDDLAPALAGQLRATGEDAGARPRVYKSGKNRWHVVTELSDGTILDPSKWAGMGKRSSPNAQGVSGAVARPFARDGGGALCVMPHRGKWWARCDVPWGDADGHLASHARGNSPDAALSRAVAGAIACGECIDSPLVERARAAGTVLLSDPEEIGSIFSALKGIAKGAASFVPGGSAALQAASLASKLAHGAGKKAPPGSQTHPNGSVSVPLEHEAPAGHDQHMMLYYHPAYAPGPVVMRF